MNKSRERIHRSQWHNSCKFAANLKLFQPRKFNDAHIDMEIEKKIDKEVQREIQTDVEKEVETEQRQR